MYTTVSSCDQKTWVKVVWMFMSYGSCQNCATEPCFITRWRRGLFAFLSFLRSQTTKEANHYFFSRPILNTKYWNQGYKKDFHFQVLLFFLEKASRRISQGVGGVQRIWEESHSVPPACTQAWEFQSQITNITGYRKTLHTQWLFAVTPELMLLLQGKWCNSKCIFSTYIYWPPPSQHEQRIIDYLTGQRDKAVNFYGA